MAGFDDNAQYIEAEKLKAELNAAMNNARSMASAMQGVTSALSQHQTGILKDVASLIQRQSQFNQQRRSKQQEMQLTDLEISAAKKRLQISRQSTQQMEDALDAAVAAGESEERLSVLRERFYAAKVKDELADQNITIRLAQVKKDQVTQLKKLPYAQMATAAADLTTAMKNITQQINKTQEQFGIAAGQAANLKVDNIVSSFNSYVESAKSLFSGKPEFGVSAEMIEGAQAAYQNEFGGILTTGAAKDLAMQARTMGVTAEQLTKARRVFTAQSLGNVAEAKKSQDKFIAEFAKKGLTSKDAMQAISQYSELLARNGTRFAQSFTRAAADAKKIGVDLSKVSQFGDSLISDFEGFLEGQAGLGAMGFNLDSNRLAQISETGSDADLFNELRSQLASTGKDITKLRRSERLELESAFGMSISEMQKLAGETPDGDTKSPEELQAEGNGSLAKIAVGMDLLTKLLSAISTGALALIAANSVITAFSTSTMAAGVATLLAPIAAGIATIAAVALLWKLGSKIVEQGKENIAKGETSKGILQTTGGRSLQGMGIGAAISALALAGTYFSGGLATPLTGPMLASGLATMGIGAGLGAGLGAAGGMGEGIYTAATKGNDVVSQPGYGKRSLVTPSGVIALNNKDNIIAYADDLDGTKKLPYGSIAKKAVEKYEQLDVFKKQVNDTFAQLISPSGGFGQISKFLNKDLGAAATNKVMSGKVGGAIAKAQELKAGGTGGLLGKVGLGSLGGSLLGGPMGLAGSLAAPLLEKIPFVGGALASIAGGPGKLMGSALGKIGGLFGKKKAPAVSAMGAMMPEMGNVMSMLPFLSGTQSTGAQGTAQPQAPISVDTAGIEKQLNNFINALQNIQIHMDGAKVGNVLVNSNDAASSIGVFREQSR